MIEDLPSIISKKIAIQIAVKAVSNIASSNRLVITLFVFGAYAHMHNVNLLTLSIIQNEIRKILAKNQVADALNTKKRLLVDLIYL